MAQRQCITPFRCLKINCHGVRWGGARVKRLEPSRRYSCNIAPLSRPSKIPRLYSEPYRGPIGNRTLLRPGPSLTTTDIECPIRTFTSSSQLHHGDLTPPKPGQERHVTFIDKEGHEHTFEVADGDNLLDIAQANDLEMEGACGGSCACSTCHVIVKDDEFYDNMEEPSDDENDMLDLAFGLTETSRLGCQVQMSKELDGLVVSMRQP